MPPKPYTIFTPQFFICPECRNRGIFIKDMPSTQTICHCGCTMSELTIHNQAENEATAHIPDVIITGGLKHGVVHITIAQETKHPMDDNHYIEWIYFQGRQGNGQFICLRPGDKPTAAFALSGNDAYAYCDRQVCIMGRGCKFRCRGEFKIYICCSRHEIWQITL